MFFLFFASLITQYHLFKVLIWLGVSTSRLVGWLFFVFFLVGRGGGGWSGGAMVLGKLPVPGRPTIWIIVGQGPIALAVGAGGGCLDIFTLLYLFPSSFSLSLGNGPI